LALFLDNLSVHKTKSVRKAMEDLDISPIYNVPYSPQFNGIEHYWSLSKQKYRKKLLMLTTEGETVNIRELVEKSILEVGDQAVKGCARHGEEKILRC